MFNFKSQLLGIAAVLPVAAAGLFASAGSAQAYTGGFNYSNAAKDIFSSPTKATISKTAINFTPDPGLISLALTSGSFLGDTYGSIFSLTTSPFTSPSKFIDVGVLDGNKQLSLTSIFAPVFSSQPGFPSTTDINIGYAGVFEDGSAARGFITFATQNSQAETLYKSGRSFDATFTGVVVTAVPEPTTMLGLGLVAAGMTVARRRKLVKA